MRLPFLAEPGEKKPAGAAVRGIFHAADLEGKHAGTTESPA